MEQNFLIVTVEGYVHFAVPAPMAARPFAEALASARVLERKYENGDYRYYLKDKAEPIQTLYAPVLLNDRPVTPAGFVASEVKGTATAEGSSNFDDDIPF